MKSEDKIGRWIKGDARESFLARGVNTMGELFADPASIKIIGEERWRELLACYSAAPVAAGISVELGDEGPVAIAEIQLADAVQTAAEVAEERIMSNPRVTQVNFPNMEVVALARALLIGCASSPRGNLSTSWVHTCFEVAQTFVTKAERYGNA